MSLSSTKKSHYSEAEAAKALGISIDQLHALILNHIVENSEDLRNVPRAIFHPSDLLVLRLLAGRLRPAIAQN